MSCNGTNGKRRYIHTIHYVAVRVSEVANVFLNTFPCLTTLYKQRLSIIVNTFN